MAILPVYTTSKLHAARINLRQTPSSTPGVLVNYVKGRVFDRKWAWFVKNFRGRTSAPDRMNPRYEILDPPLASKKPYKNSWRMMAGHDFSAVFQQ